MLGPLRIFATIEASNCKFGTQIGFGTSLPKNEVQDQNWRRSGLGEHPKKIRTPYLFLQPLKLATSNLVYNLGLGLAYQKTTIWTKIGGVWARGASEENVGPPTYFCSRRSQQLQIWYTNWVWDQFTEKRRLGPKLPAVWATEASKNNLGPPTYFCNR